MTPKVLSLAEGLEVLGLKKSAAYKRFADPVDDIPRPFAHGGKKCFLEEDLHAWLRRKAAEANGRTAAPPPISSRTAVAAELADMLAATLRRAS